MPIAFKVCHDYSQSSAEQLHIVITDVDELEGSFDKFEQQQDILVEQTFHKDQSPSFKIYGRPALTKKEEKKLLNKVKSIKGIRSIIKEHKLLKRAMKTPSTIRGLPI